MLFQKRRATHKKAIDTFQVRQREETEGTPKVNQQKLPEGTTEKQHQEQPESTTQDQHQEPANGQLEGEEQLQNVGMENVSDEFFEDAVAEAHFLFADNGNINLNITDLANIEGK